MTIRKATEADLERISSLHADSIRGLCKGHYTGEQIEAWTSVLGPAAYRPALNAKIFIVSEDDNGRIQGIGILDRDNREISAIYVAPDAAGNHVGGEILFKFETMARESGIPELTVHSTLNARGFYLKKGYREKGAAFHCLPNGVRLECVAMTKELPPAT